MTLEKLEKLLNEGEGFTLEYKECVNALSDSVFETVCSFSNRYGGYILLGIRETKKGGRKVGQVVGVNPEKISDLKKNFVTQLNNPNKMSPSLYLSLEEFDYKNKKVLWVYVPVSSQLQMCSGRIYDRNEDADQDITTSVDLAANIINRKSAIYTERTVFPYAKETDFRKESIEKARIKAVNKYEAHPWGKMSDIELLKSAGLYGRDRITGKEGFTLACILLFGTNEAIMSCAPGYKVDAIYRYENMDRYDDRLIVEENLVESYDLLMDFVRKHTNDKFALVDNVSKSIRDAIAREIISNILVHREFSSAFPAKIIIEKERLYAENWSRTNWRGRLTLDDFTAYPKNPTLANIFNDISYADSLGSGVRNLYKYTKMYSNAEPDIVEGEIFKITVPINNIKVGGASVDIYSSVSEQYAFEGVTEKVIYGVEGVTVNAKMDITGVTKEEKRITDLLKENPEYKISELVEMLGISRKTVNKHLKSLKEKGVIERVGSDKKGYWNLYQ